MTGNPLARDRWVRIESDFGASGVWNRDGAACTPDWLPVAAATVAHIRAWQETYDDIMLVFERMDPSELEQKMRAHWSEGFVIAHAVKAELPDWTVVVGDAPFEYEVVPRARRRSKPPD